MNSWLDKTILMLSNMCIMLPAQGAIKAFHQDQFVMSSFLICLAGLCAFNSYMLLSSMLRSEASWTRVQCRKEEMEAFAEFRKKIEEACSVKK